jgi:ubiquinone/menaquinone biosynthesis C-methylase UbiE
VTEQDLATHRAAMPQSTGAILDTRTLANSHRRLLELLKPGLTVLDVGCGTGAITRGIAEAQGSHVERVVGADVHAGFIEQARSRQPAMPGLSFAVADVYALPWTAEFDLVNAARVLQWRREPAKALAAMIAAVRPGGRALVLDYCHDKIAWHPQPPASMKTFYAAFLAWRAEAGMDNAIADHLPAMFAAAGLEDVGISVQHETTRRGDADFATRAGIWADVAASRGHQMVADGACDEATRAAAEVDYRRWVDTAAERQTMYLLAVDGVRPGG